MSRTILVIESNEGNANAVGRNLRLEPFYLITAKDPHEAASLVDQPIDLIICDLATAQSSALEVLRHWQHPLGCPPLVVVIDGGDVQSAVEAMQLGAVDCLTKPIDSDRLRKLVRQILAVGDENHRPTSQEAAYDDAGSGNNGHCLKIPAGQSLEDLERAAIKQALEQHYGNRTHAAQELGISVRTLQRKLKAWRIPLLSQQLNSARPNACHSESWAHRRAAPVLIRTDD